MQTGLKRYELFGWDYEHHCPLSEQEANWYKRFLRKTGGPVLELACGTGRLLTCLAKEGCDVVGIDFDLVDKHFPGVVLEFVHQVRRIGLPSGPGRVPAGSIRTGSAV